MRLYTQLALMMLAVLLATACSKDDDEIKWNKYNYEIVAEGIDIANNDAIVFDHKGGTRTINLHVVTAEYEDKRLEFPTPQFEAWVNSYDSWLRVRCEGSQLIIEVDEYEKVNGYARSTDVDVTLVNDNGPYIACSDLRLHVTQNAKETQMTWKRIYISSSMDGTVSQNGWHFTIAGDNYAFIEFYNFNKDNITVSFSDGQQFDYEVETSQDIAGEYNYSRPYYLTKITLHVKHNDTGWRRTTKATFSNSLGESQSFDIVQDYSSMFSSFYSFDYGDKEYKGWKLNYRSGSPACFAWVRSYSEDNIEPIIYANWVSVYEAEVIDKCTDLFGTPYWYWRFQFSVTENTGYSDRSTDIYFWNPNTKEMYGPATVMQLWQYSSGGSTGGGTGGGGGGTTTDETAGYTVTSTSVCAIFAAKNSSSGDKYSKNWYKWVSSTGRVILSSSKISKSGWVGVASSNVDRTCCGYSVGSYKYKYTDYSSVAGTWYYYFN